jgi:hypothetical protein
MKSYRLRDLKDRTTSELLWFVQNCYPQMKNRKSEAQRILKERGVLLNAPTTTTMRK